MLIPATLPQLRKGCYRSLTGASRRAEPDRCRCVLRALTKRWRSMKVFTCQACGQLLYFENVRCKKCGHALGYLPDRQTISAIEPLDNGAWLALADRAR